MTVKNCFTDRKRSGVGRPFAGIPRKPIGRPSDYFKADNLETGRRLAEKKTARF